MGHEELDLQRSGGLAFSEPHWEATLPSDGTVPVAPQALISAPHDRSDFNHELGSGGMPPVCLARDLQHETLICC